MEAATEEDSAAAFFIDEDAMPFAGYKDFDACVRANKDKDDPKGYCAELMRRTEKTMGESVSMHETRITKIDADRQIVFGWANVAIGKTGDQLVDSQGDSIDWEELEAAAYDFNLTFRETGADHLGTAKGRLIESFMVTPDKLEAMGLEKSLLPLGWWVGFRIDDSDTWQEVKKGTYKMFSIQGTAIREEDIA